MALADDLGNLILNLNGRLELMLASLRRDLEHGPMILRRYAIASWCVRIARELR